MSTALATIFVHGFVWSVLIVCIAWVIVSMVKS
jgi:uncharacterized membrane protein YciS (DUF1049 family)